MSVKTRLLKVLEESRDRYVSGVALAKELSVSRNAIWKAVESLRTEGYSISAATNNGYRLEDSGDILSVAGITKHIKTGGVFLVEVRETVTSTNTILRDLAVKGMPEGFVLAAEGQTYGKGRHGRGFFSPAGNGAYFSLLLRPRTKAQDASLITSAAAVAVANAIEQVTGINAGIKWVNDLFARGRKVCGILTEATISMENGMIESAVLGIGINITEPQKGYPREIEDIAGALTSRNEGVEDERCRLIAATLDNFWEYYQYLLERRFLDEYRSRSIILGQDIFVVTSNVKRPARALEIDDDCGLVVRYDDGETTTLASGEVSIRQ